MAGPERGSTYEAYNMNKLSPGSLRPQGSISRDSTLLDEYHDDAESSAGLKKGAGFNDTRTTLHDPYSPIGDDASSRYSRPDRGFAGDSPKSRSYTQDASLIGNAADMGRRPHFRDPDDPEYTGMPTAPLDRQTDEKRPWAKFAASGKYPIEQRIENKKRGIGRQRYPFVVWTLTAIMVAVFIYELVVNARAQGTPISFKPVVNPMLGPSEYALINLGARFPPCMKSVQGLSTTTQIPCLNDTANPPDRLCSVEDVCGFGGFHDQTPNQWFRFITPIFLHAGIIHILLNMLAQMTASAQIEREMGSGSFLILYMAAGIFGNVLGANFALVGAPSTGASGAIMGTIAVSFIDLFAHWKYHYRPVRRLVAMLVELVITVAIGYIPYVDNFAHLGGLLIGFLLGMTFYPIISTTTKHRSIAWALRIAAIPLVVVLFVVLIRNFYTSDPYAACPGCRYLSCIPTSSNNHCQGTGFSYANSTT
ncbi:rhomboid-domain-containing protein, partial [Heliocybe sulcata]